MIVVVVASQNSVMVLETTFILLPGATDGAPEPPQDLAVFPQSPTSMMLTWDPPVLTDLDHYVVYVEDEDMEDTTKDTHYIFNNLEACKDYTFGVMSVSAAGDTSDPLLGEGQTEDGRKLLIFTSLFFP